MVRTLERNERKIAKNRTNRERAREREFCSLSIGTYRMLER